MTTPEKIRQALEGVLDPEIRRPITELDMVRGVEVSPDGAATITIALTIAGCPLKDTITRDVTNAATGAGATSATVELTVMTTEERAELRKKLRGGVEEPVIPFNEPGNLTRIFAVASGKGGVGKSSVTANLAASMAADGLKVGVLDADVYGFSIPRMLGVDLPPSKVDDMILPPVAGDIKVISIGMFTQPGRPVVWRGPMLHRALQQFLAEVFWGDLDVLLLDLPPGTGDIAISVAQMLPGAELLIVTTPQLTAAEVAERAGVMSQQTGQHIAGVIENMSWLEQPDGSRLELFGSGGGQRIAERIGEILGTSVPLLGQVPLDIALREGSDSGEPVVGSDTSSAQVLNEIARSLTHRTRGLEGKKLSVTPL